VKAEFPWENDIDLFLDGKQETDIRIDCNHFPGDSTFKTPLGRIRLIEDEEAEFKIQVPVHQFTL
jgi:hypothetical protein